jgi:hypothetical protein
LESLWTDLVHTGSENRLNDKYISPLQEVLHWPNTPKIKFKGNTERIMFVIICRTWKALFQGKKTRKKKNNLLNWKERSSKKKSDKRTQQVNLVFNKPMIKGKCVSTALGVIN